MQIILLYVVPAWGVFASVADASRIDALLKCVDKSSFSRDIVTLNELLKKSGISLLQKMHFLYTV